jgi:hypothetical protein
MSVWLIASAKSVPTSAAMSTPAWPAELISELTMPPAPGA